MTNDKKQRYTPGPWQFARFKHRSSVNFIETVNGLRIVGTSITEADARLIAEAPAMLELIKRGMAMDANPNYDECPCNLCKAGRVIIARVEGQ